MNTMWIEIREHECDMQTVLAAFQGKPFDEHPSKAWLSCWTKKMNGNDAEVYVRHSYSHILTAEWWIDLRWKVRRNIILMRLGNAKCSQSARCSKRENVFGVSFGIAVSTGWPILINHSAHKYTFECSAPLNVEDEKRWKSFEQTESHRHLTELCCMRNYFENESFLLANHGWNIWRVPFPWPIAVFFWLVLYP